MSYAGAPLDLRRHFQPSLNRFFCSGGSQWLCFGMGLLDITGTYLAGLWFLLTGVRRNLERAAEPENPRE